MAQVAVNDLAVVKGSIPLPAKGAWVADLDIDSDTTLPTGQRAVTITLASQTLVGTVAPDRQGVYAGKLTARIVGGGNGLAKELPAKKYRGVPVAIPLADIMAETGEVLSATSTAATLNAPLAHWSRTKAKASSALETLLSTVGATWRVLPDGSIWVGTNSYPETQPDGEIIEERHGGNWRLLAAETGTLLPATTLLGRKIETVVYRIAEDSFRAEAWAV